MATINMLIIKHMKQESVRSVIDVVVDKEITTLSGIVPEEMEKHFRQVGHQKNTYRMETEPGDLLVLELMKSIRKKQWQLMTSHSFVHLSIEKIMESHFYFERVVNPFPSTPPSAAAPIHNEQLHQSQQKATTTTVPADEKKTTQPVETINRIKSDPEVAALILDRSKQQGPYTFTNRQTLASAQKPKSDSITGKAVDETPQKTVVVPPLPLPHTPSTTTTTTTTNIAPNNTNNTPQVRPTSQTVHTPVQPTTTPIKVDSTTVTATVAVAAVEETKKAVVIPPVPVTVPAPVVIPPVVVIPAATEPKKLSSLFSPVSPREDEVELLPPHTLPTAVVVPPPTTTTTNTTTTTATTISPIPVTISPTTATPSVTPSVTTQSAEGVSMLSHTQSVDTTTTTSSTSTSSSTSSNSNSIAQLPHATTTTTSTTTTTTEQPQPQELPSLSSSDMLLLDDNSSSGNSSSSNSSSSNTAGAGVGAGKQQQQQQQRTSEAATKLFNKYQARRKSLATGTTTGNGTGTTTGTTTGNGTGTTNGTVTGTTTSTIPVPIPVSVPVSGFTSPVGKDRQPHTNHSSHNSVNVQDIQLVTPTTPYHHTGNNHTGNHPSTIADSIPSHTSHTPLASPNTNTNTNTNTVPSSSSSSATSNVIPIFTAIKENPTMTTDHRVLSPVLSKSPKPLVLPTMMSGSSGSSGGNEEGGEEDEGGSGKGPGEETIPSFSMRTPNKPIDEQHESERTNHYSKLGSAFVSGNVLNTSGRRGMNAAGGRGGGRGRGIQ